MGVCVLRWKEEESPYTSNSERLNESGLKVTHIGSIFIPGRVHCTPDVNQFDKTEVIRTFDRQVDSNNSFYINIRKRIQHVKSAKRKKKLHKKYVGKSCTTHMWMCVSGCPLHYKSMKINKLIYVQKSQKRIPQKATRQKKCVYGSKYIMAV